MIYLSLYNKVWIKVDTDKREVMEYIKDSFIFHVPGYMFIPSYKSGQWDGTVKVFDYKNRLLPYGLLFDLIKLLKKKNYEIKVSDELKSLFGNKEKLEITYDLKFQPYYFQKYIIEASLNFKKGLFVSPTASGKSLIIAYIINNLMKLNNLKRFLIVVPTTSLILQFYDDLIDYGIDKECIGKFYADEKDWDRTILISTWQSLTHDNEKIRKSEVSKLMKEVRKKTITLDEKEKLKERLLKIQSKEYIDNVRILMDFRQNLLESIDCVVIDEVQIAKSIEVKGLMEKINNAEWKFGCTGTLPQSRLDTCQIKSFIGPVIKKYNVKELTEGGFLNKCEINRYLISYRNALKGTLSEVKDQLFENKYRQYIFNNIVKDNEGKNILFLVDRIEKEGKVLEKHLVENFPNHQIKYIHGKIKATDREIWRKKCNEEKNVILIATYSLFQAGINIKSLSRVVLASSFIGSVRILQSIGRTLRTNKNKEMSIIYDICDQVKYIKKHGNERLKLYEQEEFEIVDIQMKEK